MGPGLDLRQMESRIWIRTLLHSRRKIRFQMIFLIVVIRAKQEADMAEVILSPFEVRQNNWYRNRCVAP